MLVMSMEMVLMILSLEREIRQVFMLSMDGVIFFLAKIYLLYYLETCPPSDLTCEYQISDVENVEKVEKIENIGEVEKVEKAEKEEELVIGASNGKFLSSFVN